MIHLDFDEEQENSLDLLIKFGDQLHQPCSPTSDSYTYSSNPRDKICVTSTSALIQTTLSFNVMTSEEEVVIVKMNQAVQQQQEKLQQLWLYVHNLPKASFNQQNQQTLRKQLDMHMSIQNKK